MSRKLKSLVAGERKRSGNHKNGQEIYSKTISLPKSKSIKMPRWLSNTVYLRDTASMAKISFKLIHRHSVLKLNMTFFGQLQQTAFVCKFFISSLLSLCSNLSALSSLPQHSCHPALRAKPSRENAISTLAGQNQMARQCFLTLTEAIGSHMRGCPHVISAVFVNSNP